MPHQIHLHGLKVTVDGEGTELIIIINLFYFFIIIRLFPSIGDE